MLISFLIISPILTQSLTVTQIPSTGTPPRALMHSTMVNIGDSFYSFGGTTEYSPTLYNDFKEFNLTSATWKTPNTGSESLPSPRKGVVSGSYLGNLYIFGGQTKTGFREDLWCYNMTTALWMLLPLASNAPSARSQAAFTQVDNILYIFGGITYTDLDSSLLMYLLYRLDLKALTITLVETTNTPEPRYGAGLVYYNNYLYMWGGKASDPSLYRISFSNKKWSVVGTSGTSPSTRNSFPYFMQGEYLYVLPGINFDLTDIAFGCFRISLIGLVWESVGCSLDRAVSAYAKYGNYIVLLGGISEVMMYNEMVIGEIGGNLSFDVISPNWVCPDPRMKHSLIKSRQYLWLFGGYSDGNLYFLCSFRDSWKFDLILGEWELLQPSASTPPARSSHAYTPALGDTAMIFGGINSDGFLDDFLIFNLLTNEWVEIYSESLPSARSDACMYFFFPILYIYGGQDENGVFSDLWYYSLDTTKVEKIQAKGATPPPLYGHRCYVDPDYTFYISGGTSTNDAPNSLTFVYYPKSNTWYILLDSSIFDRSNFSLIFMESFIIEFGGNRLTTSYSDIIKIYYNGTIETMGALKYPVCYHSAAYAGKSIYIFGGAFTTGSSIYIDIGINDFYNLTSEDFDCSQGNYGESCNFCGPGTYAMYPNTELCSPCIAGTYSNGYGQHYLSQCIPCEYGTFSDVPGSSYCKDCAIPQDCPIGSTAPMYSQTIQAFANVQPPSYQNNNSEAMLYTYTFYIILGVLTVILGIGFILLRNNRLLIWIDIYQNLHKRKYYEEPFRTQFGGFVTVLLIMAVLIMVGSPIILYEISNITETKTLVPAFTLENQEFSSEKMILTLNLYNFAGECISNNICSSYIKLSIENMVYSGVSGPFCTALENSCSIILSCFNCYLPDNSYFNLTFAGYLIYTSGIEVELNCSSSLPDYNVSSIKFYIESPSTQVFNGLSPSIFYIMMIPTVRSI